LGTGINVADLTLHFASPAPAPAHEKTRRGFPHRKSSNLLGLRTDEKIHLAQVRDRRTHSEFQFPESTDLGRLVKPIREVTEVTPNRPQAFESPVARHFGTEMGTPKPADFALEAATSVRNSTLFDPMMRSSWARLRRVGRVACGRAWRMF
jgi:hypothetical protein